jgi:hypothetical protein
MPEHWCDASAIFWSMSGQAPQATAASSTLVINDSNNSQTHRPEETMPTRHKFSWAEEAEEVIDSPGRGQNKRPGKSRQQRSSAESSDCDVMQTEPGSSKSHRRRGNRRNKQRTQKDGEKNEPAAALVDQCAALSSTSDDQVPLSRSAASEVNLLLLGMGV